MNTGHRALGLRMVLISSLAGSWAAGAQQQETRPRADFNAIEVSGGIDLFVRQGQSFFVEVESEGDLADVVTEVRGATLEIKRRRTFDFFNWDDDDSAVHVTLPTLTRLTASGGSDVRSEGAFTSDDLEIVASGGSDVVLDVSAATLQVQASGGSDVRLSGSARSARVHSSGGSDLNASGLTADEADLHSSGGSDLSIAVRDSLVANASGGSDISYTGDPRSVDVNSSGGADVRRR